MDIKVFSGIEINSIASQIRDGVELANNTELVCDIPKFFTIEKTIGGATYTATFPLMAKGNKNKPHVPQPKSAKSRLKFS